VILEIFIVLSELVLHSAIRVAFTPRETWGTLRSALIDPVPAKAEPFFDEDEILASLAYRGVLLDWTSVIRASSCHESTMMLVWKWP